MNIDGNKISINLVLKMTSCTRILDRKGFHPEKIFPEACNLRIRIGTIPNKIRVNLVKFVRADQMAKRMSSGSTPNCRR
jgi:hypothetical protein